MLVQSHPSHLFITGSSANQDRHQHPADLLEIAALLQVSRPDPCKCLLEMHHSEAFTSDDVESTP